MKCNWFKKNETKRSLTFYSHRKFYFYRIKQAFTSGVVNIVKQCPNSGKSA